MSYFDPAQDWLKPIEDHPSMAVVSEELAFLGDTRSRHELLVFAQANQSRLPLAMGIVQPHIPVRRMASERKMQLTDALVRILRRVFHCRISCQLDAHSGLIAAVLAVLMIATAPEEFGVPESTTTLEAAGLCGPHRWGIILPNSSRVSMLPY